MGGKKGKKGKKSKRMQQLEAAAAALEDEDTVSRTATSIPRDWNAQPPASPCRLTQPGSRNLSPRRI